MQGVRKMGEWDFISIKFASCQGTLSAKIFGTDRKSSEFWYCKCIWYDTICITFISPEEWLRLETSKKLDKKEYINRSW